MKSTITSLLLLASTCSLQAADRALVDTSASPNAKLYMVDLDDVRWTDGFWAERFAVVQDSMIPYMWELFQSESDSHAWANFLLAAGLDDGRDGKHHGPPFNDGDFMKWFEAVASVYAVTRDPQLKDLMDTIIPVLEKAQREDGYFHTMKVIPQRQGIVEEKEFEDRYHFETYNMGHLMTAACIHYRATDETRLLEMARKATDYLYDFYKKSSPELARNAICPSHYMGVTEMYRVTKDPRYKELAQQLIEIRDLVENGTDHNQDRVPFREMKEAVGHAVRANYLYAGVADVCAEQCDHSLFETIETIADDVAGQKLYITGMTGALYDGASPSGSTDHHAIETVHQAYGRDWQLPNLTAYNETCATIGYALWNWRMFSLTTEAHYADLFEQTLYNGILPSINLEGNKYFYVNPLRKLDEFTWPLRWSRTRQPNIQLSFCCPPNIVRTIAQVQNYVYALSESTLWINLYAANTLDTEWLNGDRIQLRQETDYPWNGAVRIVIDEAPESEITLKLRIPGWAASANVAVNGAPFTGAIKPGTYAELKQVWKKGDIVTVNIPFEAALYEANPLVEETLNQVALKYGPLVYCIESNDLPEGVDIMQVAFELSPALPYQLVPQTIAGSSVGMLEVPAIAYKQPSWSEDTLYRRAGMREPIDLQLRLIPYYAWGNREEGEMTVWIPARQ
jgi:hypothetical protein